MKNQLQEFIESNRNILEQGEMLSIILNDAYLTIYNEFDKVNNCYKTITLVDPCDIKMDLNLEQLINM